MKLRKKEALSFKEDDKKKEKEEKKEETTKKEDRVLKEDQLKETQNEDRKSSPKALLSSKVEKEESKKWDEERNLNLALFLARELQSPFLQLSQLCPEQSFGFPFSEIPFEKTNQIFQKKFEEVLLKEGLDVNEAPESLLKRVCV